jgi:hypothetical protein
MTKLSMYAIKKDGNFVATREGLPIILPGNDKGLVEAARMLHSLPYKDAEIIKLEEVSCKK